MVGIAACHDTTGPTPVTTVTVTPPSVVLVIGTRLTFQTELRDSAGNVLTNRPIAWSSSDTTIVRVSQVGLATAMNLGTGTVTALNAANHKVTLDHGPIPAINWPPMKMEFAAAPSVDLAKLKTGDKVNFTLSGSGNTYTVQSISPTP